MFGNQPGTLVLSPKELTWATSSSDLSPSLWSYPFNTPLWIGMSPNKFKTYMSKMMLITNSSFLISSSLDDTPICCASNLGMVQDPQSTCSNLVASFSACKSLDCPETWQRQRNTAFPNTFLSLLTPTWLNDPSVLHRLSFSSAVCRLPSCSRFWGGSFLLSFIPIYTTLSVTSIG